MKMYLFDKMKKNVIVKYFCAKIKNSFKIWAENKLKVEEALQS